MPRDLTVLARTARKAHHCATCDWHTDPDVPPSIAAGHRYLIHVAFPGADGFEDGTRPWRAKECVSCACARDDTAGLLVADACSSFCHGTEPCALPHRHDGDHSCRECVRNRAEVPSRG